MVHQEPFLGHVVVFRDIQTITEHRFQESFFYTTSYSIHSFRIVLIWRQISSSVLKAFKQKQMTKNTCSIQILAQSVKQYGSFHQAQSHYFSDDSVIANIERNTWVKV